MLRSATGAREASKVIGTSPIERDGRSTLGGSGGSPSMLPLRMRLQRAKEASSNIGSKRSNPGSEVAGYGIATANAGSSRGPAADGLEPHAIGPLPRRNGRRSGSSKFETSGGPSQHRSPSHRRPHEDRGGGRRPKRRGPWSVSSAPAVERRLTPSLELSEKHRPWWPRPPLVQSDERGARRPSSEPAPPSRERKTVRRGHG